MYRQTLFSLNCISQEKLRLLLTHSVGNANKGVKWCWCLEIKYYKAFKKQTAAYRGKVNPLPLPDQRKSLKALYYYALYLLLKKNKKYCIANLASVCSIKSKFTFLSLFLSVCVCMCVYLFALFASLQFVHVNSVAISIYCIGRPYVYLPVIVTVFAIPRRKLNNLLTLQN